MKVGIYISGLGQSFVNETVEKYAERLKNELKFNTTRKEYEILLETINYTPDQSSTVISICEKNEPDKIIYKIYDFKYNKILTEKFNRYSIILKNIWLLLLALRKTPMVIKRLFNSASYNRPFQTLYVFFIFFLIASAVLFMLPATIAVFESTEVKKLVVSIQEYFPFLKDIPLISKKGVREFTEIIISLTAFLLLLAPNANVLIADLATEFVCANNYIQYGAQRQLIQGNLELLVDYISENEKDCQIHFHTYSFGSIIALDYIYPFGNKVSKNAELYCEALITIGTPLEFIKSYYPKFYQNRKTDLDEKIQWINVYSIADALATNFRRDSKIGDPQFGIEKHTKKPININYEVIPVGKKSVVDFILLTSIKVHSMYWDNKPEGLSCLRYIYNEMNERNLI